MFTSNVFNTRGKNLLKVFAISIDLSLNIWYNLFNEILDKHAPIVTKRVKRDKQHEWYNTEVQYARQMRDK
jgi:hypothetical protein